MSRGKPCSNHQGKTDSNVTTRPEFHGVLRRSKLYVLVSAKEPAAPDAQPHVAVDKRAIQCGAQLGKVLRLLPLRPGHAGAHADLRLLRAAGLVPFLLLVAVPPARRGVKVPLQALHRLARKPERLPATDREKAPAAFTVEALKYGRKKASKAAYC